ncbi:hypothetical protein GCM10027277_27610 [Pseudoduganella ginsengisoli]|uniref:Uncharacterized protein n=1 Tax=Pseudoduganella ginsengisoli TaxID=1462440 RepID=A0A6L6Q7S5_9BURK|nr:hypothetical protein [Pseudoduganella ginsengisoli]MTW05514.1 hypothetical protein [Pseudoduganella ginsengisoli]
MTDDEFLCQFTACTLAPEHFNHVGHVRLGWILLRKFSPDDAVRQACAGIHRYASHLGAADKFHWTITEALLRLLLAGGAANRGQDWPAFLAANAPLLIDARARLALHYSPERLAGAAARTAFVQPDRAPASMTLPWGGGTRYLKNRRLQRTRHSYGRWAGMRQKLKIFAAGQEMADPCSLTC